MPYDRLKPILKQIQVVDRSRTHHLPKVTENLPLGERDVRVLTALLQEKLGLNEKQLSNKTDYGLSAISKSLSKLIYLKFVYCKSTHPSKIFAIRPIRKNEVKMLGGLYLSGKKHDVFDSHYFIYSVDLPKESRPAAIIKRLSRRLKKKGWIEAVHPAYGEWGHPEPYGWVTIRVGVGGSVKITLRLETLAFHPLLIEEINLYKLSFFAEYLRNKYGIPISSFNLEFQCSYGEIPFLLDPFAVNAIKLGLKDRYKEVEQSWVPEWEEKGINAIEFMDKVYELRVFCKKHGITEYCLSKFFSDRPELLQELAKKAAETASGKNQKTK